MAKQIIVSIYDKKAQTYSNLGLYPNTLVALRDFSELCKNKDSMYAKYPEDFEMHSLGVFDNHSGNVITQVENIAKASEYVEVKQNG